MFYIIPSAQSPHTLSQRASYPSYPSSDFARPRHNHHHHRRSQPAYSFADHNGVSPTDVYASQQRYQNALAQVRAAEVEYVRAQARARAEEQARIERQRALEAAARQRAYEVEVARMERLKVIREEQIRRERIELSRARLYASYRPEQLEFYERPRPDRTAHHRHHHRRFEQDDLDNLFTLVNGVTPAQTVRFTSPLDLQASSDPETVLQLQRPATSTNRVSFAPLPTYSSVPPTPAPETPLKPRPSVHKPKPQSDEDVVAEFITSLFGAPARQPSLRSAPQPQSQPVPKATSPYAEDLEKAFMSFFGAPVTKRAATTQTTSTTPSSTPAPTVPSVPVAEKTATPSSSVNKSQKEVEDALQLVFNIFGLPTAPTNTARPQSEKKAPAAAETQSRPVPVCFFVAPSACFVPCPDGDLTSQGIVIRDDPPKDVKGKGKAREPSPSAPSSPRLAPTVPTDRNSLSSLLDRPSSLNSLAKHLQAELLSGKLDREMEEVVTNVLAGLVGQTESSKDSGVAKEGEAGPSRSTSISVSDEASKDEGSASTTTAPVATAPTSTPAPKPSQISISPLTVDTTIKPDTDTTTEPELEVPPSPAESTRSTHSILSIYKIESSFNDLRSSFTFPSTLDFSSNSNELAYTPTNTPVRVYEHALNGLLAQLDEVESEGDEEVRGRRREVVRKVEKELEELEGKVEGLRKESVKVEVKEVKEVKEGDELREEVEEVKEVEAKVEVEEAKDVEVQPEVEQVKDEEMKIEVEGQEEAVEDQQQPEIVISTSESTPTPTTPATDSEPTSTTDPATTAPSVEGDVAPSADVTPTPVVVEEIEPSAESAVETEDSVATLSSAPTSPSTTPLLDASETVDQPPLEATTDTVVTSTPPILEPVVLNPSTSDADETSVSGSPQFLSSFTEDQFSFPPRPLSNDDAPSHSADAEDDVVVVEESSEKDGTDLGEVGVDTESESSVSVSASEGEWEEVDA